VIGRGSAVAGQSKAHGSPLGADNLREAKQRVGWPEQELLVPDDVRAYFARASAAKRAARASATKLATGAGPAAGRARGTPRARRSARSRRSAREGATGRRRTRNHGAVMLEAGSRTPLPTSSAALPISPARTRRRSSRRKGTIGGHYATAPTSTPEATFTSACASTRWPRSPTGSRSMPRCAPTAARS
jgi:hypothetical protein